MNTPHKGWKRWGCLVCCLAVLGIFTLADRPASAKEFPARAIKVIVNTTPGGNSDLWARTWADDFSKLLKVPVVISNQGGASGMSALIEAAEAPADGYTINTMTHSMVVGVSVNPNPPVDLFKDFTPIGGFGYFPSLIAVEQSSPFHTYEELANYARQNPGKLKCGSAGATMISHFTFEVLKQQAKLGIVMVPFKAAPEAVTALVGKHVDLASLPPQSLLGFAKSGRVRFLLSTQKLKDYPQVPIFADKGLKEAGINAWLGLAVRSGVPKAAQKKLADAFAVVAKNQKIVSKIEAMNFTPDYLSAADFLALLKRDHVNILKVAKQSKIGD